MIRPIVEDERPCRSERARSLRWKPSAAIASPTRAAVSAATPDSPLMTRETVFRLTPARCATSRIVGLVALTATFLLAPPDGATALSDNVVGGSYGAEGWAVKWCAHPAARSGPVALRRPARSARAW